MNTLQSPRKRTLRSRFQLFLVPLVVLLSIGCLGEEELERPEPLYGEDPVEYPLTLWDTNVEGETLLRVRVTDTGTIDSIEVSKSSGHLGLDSAAVQGVRELTFQPGRSNGRRTRMWATLPVVFSKRSQGADPVLGQE